MQNHSCRADGKDGLSMRAHGAGDNIVLIGMPGAGKSTVGVVLAKILNYNFIDADLLIQQRHGQTLQRLIDAFGADGFINIENDVLLDIDVRHTIISTGGSAIYSPDAMAHLTHIGRIVYLQVALPELESRLSDFSERGVVMRNESAEGRCALAKLYEERVPLYERFADVTVNIDGLSITEAARKVISALE